MATIKELQGAYPDVPLEVLRAPRRNKQAEMQQTIDALVAALEAVSNGVPDVLRNEGLNDAVDAALALARKGV